MCDLENQERQSDYSFRYKYKAPQITARYSYKAQNQYQQNPQIQRPNFQKASFGQEVQPNFSGNMSQSVPVMYPNNFVVPQAVYPQKSQLTAGLLAVFLGVFGVHNFYLGFKAKAIIQLILCFMTFGISCVWGFTEGILYLTGKNKTDAKGMPLKD